MAAEYPAKRDHPTPDLLRCACALSAQRGKGLMHETSVQMHLARGKCQYLNKHYATMPGRRENMPESTLEVKDTVVHASSSKFIA